MDKKLSAIVGLPKTEFDESVKRGEILLKRARLLPRYKPGDEMGLTSVILSSLRLIREFRKMVLADVKMGGAGQLHVYTEVVFPEFPDSRVDGLILLAG